MDSKDTEIIRVPSDWKELDIFLVLHRLESVDSRGLQENDLDTLQKVEKFYSDFEVSGNPVYQNF